MSVKPLTITVAALLAGCLATAQANNEASGHNWMPNQPVSNYWQAPTWSGFQTSPSYNTAPPPTYNNYQRPPPAAYRPPPANYPAAGNMNQRIPPPPAGPYSSNVPAYQPNPYQRRSAPVLPYQQRPYNGPSAFHTPGYNPNRDYRNNNGWNNNKFWGRSGPGTWMKPSKRNWENSWDDMINTPSRMGEMPGGWTAPEVTMPNPIDMGDQFQDNLKNLPEQIREGNIGNNVSN